MKTVMKKKQTQERKKDGNLPARRQPVVLDAGYREWVREVSSLYHSIVVKAAFSVNRHLLRFYWELGGMIASREEENRYGSAFYVRLETDLRRELPGVGGLSPTNLKYARRFRTLYAPLLGNRPQLADGSASHAKRPQLVDVLLCAIPWGHHRTIIDRCEGEPAKALFFVRKTLENGWSRAVLLNFLDTSLYERDGKAISNFRKRLPEPQGELAQEMTRDPYHFEFLKMTEKIAEADLKSALLTNISDFLLELGTGFAFVGREYRLQIGNREKFLDLLFYHIELRCFVVVEVKTVEFESEHIGQLGAYVAAVNHYLRKPGDNPTIGLLICKTKDAVLARFALEASGEPIAVSEYQLERIYTRAARRALPSIRDIEGRLSKGD